MTHSDIDVPAEWRVQQPTDQLRSPTKCYYRTSTGTTFIVTIVSDDDSYALRLSTETPTNVRHDYLVDKYNSCRTVTSAAESFIPHLTRRIRRDELSASDPSIDEVQQTIKAFREESVLQSLRRTIDRFL
ncbi:hypothetical protein [Halobacterium yunchengense]|uniref:hypothetical protein n=1 Tax=Halobacterium yunchengense TaxID=3108497 RepID=UPI00300B564A